MRMFKSSYNSMMSSSTTIALLYTLCLHFFAFSCVLFSSLFYMPFTLLSSFSLYFKALMTQHSLIVTFTMYFFFFLCAFFLFTKIFYFFQQLYFSQLSLCPSGVPLKCIQKICVAVSPAHPHPYCFFKATISSPAQELLAQASSLS